MLWSDKGSPLLYYGNSIKDKLQALLRDDHGVFLAMRYGNPGLDGVLEEISAGDFSGIIVMPLFPQYASSTTGTALAAVLSKIKKWNRIPDIQVISQFYNHPAFIGAFVKRIQQYHPENFDHILFSYHGLPVRHISKIHPNIDYRNCVCENQFPGHGEYCYKATCYETTRLLASKLALSKERYSQGFQSRLSDKWLMPFTDEIIAKKAQQGVKSILIVAPAFVADCLETTVELGIDYKNLFLKSGGSRLEYVESLNDMPEWINGLSEIIQTGR
jgi:ferrochelatase